jgi:VanZ family protein
LFILVGVLYGVTDEFHQAFVPGRSVSVFDWIADVVGVLMGYTIFLKTISIREARARWAADADSKNRGI